jgi:hypothetical protein
VPISTSTIASRRIRWSSYRKRMTSRFIAKLD